MGNVTQLTPSSYPDPKIPEQKVLSQYFLLLQSGGAWDLIAATSSQEGTASFSLASTTGQSLRWNSELAKTL